MLSGIIVLVILLSGCSNQAEQPANQKNPPAAQKKPTNRQNTLASVHVDPIKFEAEDGQFNGVRVSKDAPGYSGSGYVSGFKKASDSVTITVKAPAQELYQLSIGYSAPYGAKKTRMKLNGKAFGEISFSSTKKFTEASAGKVLLHEGDNTITLVDDWGWYDIDYVKIQSAEVSHEHQVTAHLVNPHATPATKALMKYLVANYGKHIISGQDDYHNIDWISQHTGKKPALVGFDLMDYSPSMAAHGASSDDVEQAIAWGKQGGIVQFQWHWNAPTDLIDEPGKEWYKGFYTKATTFNVAEAINHPDSKDYKLLLRDIDAIAVQLKKIQAAGIPVIFRPLHEAEGGWFWWGAKGPEPAKKLYRLVYERLTNYHHINNLIWVWNSASPDWYPGNDVVDIVSIDSYPKAGDYSPVSNQYDTLVSLVKDKKLVTMSENGPIPDPKLLQEYGADWSSFMTWTGDFITGGQQNSLDHVKAVYNNPYVITFNNLPHDLYGKTN